MGRGGFTLLEVIISVAALALLSVFILQMFITAANLNKRSQDVETAMTRASSEIEFVKSYSSLAEYLKTGAEASEARYTAEDGGSVTVTVYYGKDWETVPEGGGALYSLVMTIAPEAQTGEPAENAVPGKLYSVRVIVEEILSGEKSRTLASVSAKKYFPVTQTGGGA